MGSLPSWLYSRTTSQIAFLAYWTTTPVHGPDGMAWYVRLTYGDIDINDVNGWGLPTSIRPIITIPKSYL